MSSCNLKIFCEFPEKSLAAVGVPASTGIIGVVGVTAVGGITVVAGVNNVAGVILLNGFSSITKTCLIFRAP